MFSLAYLFQIVLKIISLPVIIVKILFVDHLHVSLVIKGNPYLFRLVSQLAQFVIVESEGDRSDTRCKDHYRVTLLGRISLTDMTQNKLKVSFPYFTISLSF